MALSKQQLVDSSLFKATLGGFTILHLVLQWMEYMCTTITNDRKKLLHVSDLMTQMQWTTVTVSWRHDMLKLTCAKWWYCKCGWMVPIHYVFFKNKVCGTRFLKHYFSNLKQIHYRHFVSQIKLLFLKLLANALPTLCFANNVSKTWFFKLLVYRLFFQNHFFGNCVFQIRACSNLKNKFPKHSHGPIWAIALL